MATGWGRPEGTDTPMVELNKSLYCNYRGCVSELKMERESHQAGTNEIAWLLVCKTSKSHRFFWHTRVQLLARR